MWKTLKLIKQHCQVFELLFITIRGIYYIAPNSSLVASHTRNTISYFYM